MGIALVLVLTFGSWSALQIYRSTSDALEIYLERTGVSIAGAVAARSEDYILTNNLYQLHSLINDTLDNNPDVRYLFILGGDEEVISSSFSLSLPEGLKEVNTIPKDNGYSLKTIKTEEGLIDDIAVPILGGRAGTVRLGVSRQGSQTIVLQIVRQILIMTFSVSLLGLIVAYILATVILKPINELLSATETVGRGDFSIKLKPWAKDEIGRLMQSFNLMTESLYNLRKKSINYREELERKEYLRLQLQKKIISSQEEERKRISRELHDDTGQSLTSLKLVLKRIEEVDDLAEAKKIAYDMREMLAETLEGVRALSRDLRPSVLDDMGLKVALERYLEDCSKRLDICLDFQVYGLENWQPASYLSITIYRVVQEAITNIVKHAKASNVSVIMEKRANNVVVVIEDDGVGFDINNINSVENKEPSLGIFGMNERAHLIGGDLVIESAVGQGTTVYLKIPLLEKGDNNLEQN